MSIFSLFYNFLFTYNYVHLKKAFYLPKQARYPSQDVAYSANTKNDGSITSKTWDLIW